MANKADLATSTVLTAPSPATSGTSVVVQSGHGARFPTAPFYATAHPDGQAPTLDNSEIVYISAKSTDTFTITRAQKGTSAQSIAVGWRISNAIYAGDLDNTSIVRNEVPGGSVNSSNTAFTTASVFASGSLRVYRNGLRLKGSGNDFSESATLNGFTMTTAPTTGDLLLVDYEVGSSTTQVGTNSFIAYETPSGSVNSSNTVFTTARAYIAGSLQVYIDGIFQRITTDYAETTPGSGTLTMATAPATGQSIRVSYQYNLNPSSNADTVDGIHANSTATANQLYPLDSNAKLPSSIFTVPYKFHAYRNAAFSTPAGATSKISCDSESFDTGGNYDNATNYRFTAPVAGFYVFTGAITAGTWARAFAELWKNGAVALRGPDYTATAAGGTAYVSGMLQLAANDYVELYMYSATSGTGVTGATYTYFQGYLLSAT